MEASVSNYFAQTDLFWVWSKTVLPVFDWVVKQYEITLSLHHTDNDHGDMANDVPSPNNRSNEHEDDGDADVEEE